MRSKPRPMLYGSSRMVRSSVSVVERLEYQLHGWSSYLIVPVFALANAGVELSGDSVWGSLTSTVGVGFSSAWFSANR